MSPGRPDPAVVRRHLLALDRAVDLEVVHRLLNERLSDFEEFARHLERHLGRGQT